MTDAEQRLWQHLRFRRVGGYKFRRQQPIGPYIVDFICFEKRLIIEVDGTRHEDEQAQDTQRTAWLESQGFRVIRFWNADVYEEIDEVCDAIHRVLTVDDSEDPPS